MIQIDCPHCGRRDEAEFAYRGDATKRRPGPDGSEEAFHDYVYARRNPRGWHLEWWYHAHGCKRVLKVLRDTATHQVAAVVTADADAPAPPA